ncbi:unnamed protein product [Gongylonema pulchrum]|uniref:Very-long-chain (3R)-3-hydroxyacyl-CoA dehydratase n=1 Tax=Gongylonema pulchrum TaxID=637853 RepID=A0A183ENX0_9BILA|nr:unnamed protein product [Gongylonema pulchrum]
MCHFYSWFTEFCDIFWKEYATVIKIATALQLIDLVHAVIGFTKGSYRTGLFRYPYYAASSLEVKVNLLTWLRYNAWIPIYPLGLILEGYFFHRGITMYRVLPYYYRTDRYSIELPNPANFAFNFAVALGIFLFFVFPFGKFQFSKFPSFTFSVSCSKTQKKIVKTKAAKIEQRKIEIPPPLFLWKAIYFALHFASGFDLKMCFIALSVVFLVAKYLLTHMWIQRQKKYKSDLKKAA